MNPPSNRGRRKCEPDRGRGRPIFTAHRSRRRRTARCRAVSTAACGGLVSPSGLDTGPPPAKLRPSRRGGQPIRGCFPHLAPRGSPRRNLVARGVRRGEGPNDAPPRAPRGTPTQRRHRRPGSHTGNGDLRPFASGPTPPTRCWPASATLPSTQYPRTLAWLTNRQPGRSAGVVDVADDGVGGGVDHVHVGGAIGVGDVDVGAGRVDRHP